MTRHEHRGPLVILAIRSVLVMTTAQWISVAPLWAATVTHIYELNGTYADTLGGPSLVPTGGTLGGSSYTFGNPANTVNQGLSLSNAFASSNNYAIEMRFRWTGDLNGYGRILDFNTVNDDRGIYTLSDNRMSFWMPGPGPTGSATMGINSDFHVVFTRASGTNVFTAFLNGAQQFQFTDSSGLANFSSPGNIAQFFIDDNTAFDTRPGIVDQICIFDGPLSLAQVQTLYTGNGLSRLPVGDAGGPYTLPLGNSLLLNASASSDPDQEFGDSIVDYAWDLNGDGAYDFSSASPFLTLLPSQYAPFLTLGSNTPKLQVTDGLQHHATVSAFSIDVVPAPEPSTLVLALCGAIASVAFKRRRRSAKTE